MARPRGLAQSDPTQNFNNKVMAVLRNPGLFPPEFSAWIRAQIVRNPLVKIEPYQLPTLDKKHQVGIPGEPPFANSWVLDPGFEGPSFYKDSNGRVFLQGRCRSGAIGTGSVIFTLPPGYRPLSGLTFVVLTGGETIGRCDVTVAGSVIAYAGSNAYFSLSGISFRI